jgi:hypothetical protein
MDQIAQYVEPVRQFSKDSIRLVKRCTKPDRKGDDRNSSFRHGYKTYCSAQSYDVWIYNYNDSVVVG